MEELEETGTESRLPGIFWCGSFFHLEVGLNTKNIGKLKELFTNNMTDNANQIWDARWGVRNLSRRMEEFFQIWCAVRVAFFSSNRDHGEDA